jgi:hypothetical protein
MKHNFKIRCSAIGQIMTDPRSKSDLLSKTTITYLETWAKEQIYGRQKEIKTKYMDKGNLMEDEAIEFVSERLKLGMLFKNEQQFEDEHLTGTPDIILPDTIIDIKCSWDCFTFPLFDQDLPEKDYYWQMQGYMALTGKQQSKVIYCLMDTPDEIIEREMRSYFWGQDEIDESDEIKFIANHKYSTINPKYRIKEFNVYRNNEDIQRIYNKVNECKTFIETL